MELIDYFDRGVFLAPDAPCLVEGERSWTYGDGQTLTKQVASALTQSGLEPGAHVAVMSDGDPRGFLCVLGALRAQMVWLPVATSSPPADIAALLDAFDCDFLFYDSRYSEAASVLRESLPRLRATVCIDATDAGAPSLEAWLSGSSPEFDIEPADLDSVAAILPTGGTTGLSKGVPRTHRDFLVEVATHLALMPLRERPKYLFVASPTTRVGWQSFKYLVRGATLHTLIDAKPIDIIRAIEKYRITDMTLVTHNLYGILAEPEFRSHDYSSLRYLSLAGEMTEVKLREAIEIFGKVVIRRYNQAEVLASSTLLGAEDVVTNGEMTANQRLRSSGRPTPFVQVGVMDRQGRLLGRDAPGELVVRGDSVMRAYYKDAEASEKAWQFGWFHTGDYGYYDEDGFFYVVDRVNDLIEVNGIDIAPREIERVLWEDPAVRDCAVVGVAGKNGVDEVVAVIETVEGAVLEADAMLERCRSSLGESNTPGRVEVWPELPRGPRGKVLKRKIREQLRAAASGG